MAVNNCNSMVNDIASELKILLKLKGAAHIMKLKEIASRKEFHPLEGNPEILTVGGEKSEDYPFLLNGAKRAVEHGYKVLMLPNPKGARTADYIFIRRNVFKLYDLKTITGKNIIESQLLDSIGQVNRVILNMPNSYNTRLLVADIKTYFEVNPDALEVLIFKGHKEISVRRRLAENAQFYTILKKLFEQ